MTAGLLLAIMPTTASPSLRAGQDTLACVQDTTWQRLLEGAVRDDFLLSPAWVDVRQRWRWHAAPADITAITDPALCTRASRAIAAAGRSAEPYRPILLVRAGNLYVASPPESADEWIFLDSHWRVLDHVVVPS
jgi:hypothetical protein